MNRIEVNVLTNKKTVVELTPEEEAAINNRIITAEEFNAPIKAKIVAIDLKRIRPLAEGDAVFLTNLNDQIKALRAQIKK